MRFPRYLHALAVALSPWAWSGGIRAGEPLGPGDAVRIATAAHPMNAAADFEVAAAEADRDLARTAFIPRVDLQADWVRSTNPTFVFASKLGQEIFGLADFDPARLNDPDPFTNAATRLVLSQNVWDAGMGSLRRDAAGLGLEVASAGRTRVRDQIAFGALQAFWDAVLADQMRDVARRAEGAAQANADLSREQVDAGFAVPSDRMAAEVRLAEVRAMRIRAEQMVLVARAALRRALGVTEPERDFDLVIPETALLPPEGKLADRIVEALAARPDLRAIDRRIEQAEVAEEMSRHLRYPTVGLGAQYEWNDNYPLGNSGSNWTVGLALRVPVWDGLETRARIARSSADLQRARAMRQAMADGIRLEVSSAWADQAAADERLLVARGAEDLAREALRIVRERYAEGMAVMVELLSSEVALTQAEASHVDARRSVALARAAVDLATGRTLLEDAEPDEVGHE